MRSGIIGFTLGILLLQQQSDLWSWPVLIAMASLSIGTFLIKKFIRSSVLKHAVMLIAGGLFGWAWASGFALVQLEHQLNPEIEEQDITVIGVITNLPARTEYGQRFQFLIEQVLTANVEPQHVPQKVMLNWYDANANSRFNFQANVSDTFHQPLLTSLQSGERWRLKVRLRRPHGLANPYGFDYEVWLLERGVGATGSVKNDPQNQKLADFVVSLNNGIEWARGKLRDRILTALPNQPYAPILVALVIGEQNAIAQHDWTLFARTGISHLIAISGLHITLLSGMLASVMFYLWRHSFFTRYQLPLILPAQKVAALAGVLMAWLYVALAGFGVPAQRTLVMIAVGALACWFDRIISVTNVLCLALLAVLLMDPWAVLSPGFWLSFSAVGILFYISLGRHELNHARQAELVSPTISSKWLALKNKFFQHLYQGSMAQYAITLGLLPLTMLLFSQMSLVSPIANAVAIPLVTFAITPCALLGSVLPAPLGSEVLVLSHFMLQQLVVLLAWLSQFSWAVWQTPQPEIWMFVCASLGVAWCLAPRGWPLRWAGLLTWLPLCLNSSVYPHANQFKVTALDVGQGMALLIETAQHRMLYDTGPGYSAESNAGSNVIYPYLKMRDINQLDGLVISHSDNDHSGGALSLLQQLHVSWVMSSLEMENSVVQNAKQVSQHVVCMAGQRWQWDGVQFEVLHPTQEIYANQKWKPNARSCTLKITHGEYSILLAGDIEARQEAELIQRVPQKLPATVLLAPHHGSGTSSSTPFLRMVHPEIAIFQLGYHNRYHHPKASVWERYAGLGIVRLRTDWAGAITINFGDQMNIEEYRKTHARYWYPVPEAGQ